MALTMLLLSACVPVANTRVVINVQPSSTSAPEHIVTATDTTSPQPDDPAIATPDLMDTPFVTAENTNAPLRFAFPSQIARPKSAWRPPLYNIPWAMTPYDHFLFARPIGADEVNWPEADYRYGAPWPGLPNIIHTGIDIAAPIGTPVLAAGPGKVVWAGVGLMYGPGVPNDPYGNAVAISHDFGYNGQAIETIYGHMSEIDVVVGQHLNTGDQVGMVGMTGLTTGPHLHFEVRLEDAPQFYTTRNPELWLAPPQGWGVLVGRLTDGFNNKLLHQEVDVKSDDTGQRWIVNSYASDTVVKSDAYYRENLVLSDLPNGGYTITLNYQGTTYTQTITIHPGMVSYFTFMATTKFSTSAPPTPDPNFLVTPSKAP